MSYKDFPINLQPETIGKVVTIQVFKRTVAYSDTLSTDVFLKVVGRLQAYSVWREVITYKIEGFDPKTVNVGQECMEVYLRESRANA